MRKIPANFRINIIHYEPLKKIDSEGSFKDDPENFSYPMPIDAENTDSVYVGRIREDFSEKNSLNLWIVSDNLRKGAATNAIQIMEYLEKKGFRT